MEKDRGNERPGGGGVETEVSCLRRRPAEEDRCRGKKVSQLCVCVCVCRVSHQGWGWGGWRLCGLWLGCVSGGGGHYPLLPQERGVSGERSERDHFWFCFLVSTMLVIRYLHAIITSLSRHCR